MSHPPADPLSAVARVTREVSERWTAAHDVTLATWLAAQSALRTMPTQREKLCPQRET